MVFYKVKFQMLFLEDKLYYMTREKVLAVMILFFSLVFLGISAFLLITSAVGSAVVIARKVKSHKNDSESHPE